MNVLNQIDLDNFYKGKIIVVEGKNDSKNLEKIFPNIITFETSGLGLTEEMIEQLRKIVSQQKLTIYVFTDPDTPGEIIRKIMNENFDNVVNVYIANQKAISKNNKKVGIEHVSKDDIISSFLNAKIIIKDENLISENYTIEDLQIWGLYGNRYLREKLSNELGIAYGNNKKILKQLNSYQVSRNKIEEALEKLGE